MVIGAAEFQRHEMVDLMGDAFDHAENAVVCAVHWHGQGKTSGMNIDVDQFDVFEFAGGRVVRATLGYRSKAEALEAVGLSE